MNGQYCGPPPLPDDVLARWNLDPLVLLALAAFTIAFARKPGGVSAAGVLAVVFVSPLCALSAALFSARVVHHVLLVAVAAPLMATAMRRGSTHSPGLSLAAFTCVLWIWHIPSAYELAQSKPLVYWAMQATLLASAIWFWNEVLASGSSLIGLPLVVAGFAQMGLLGALITLAPVPLYLSHAVAPISWGLAPITDQQLGGVIMWVPAGIPFGVVAAVLVRRVWLENRSFT